MKEERLQKLEVTVEKIQDQVENHIPSKIDKVIDNQETMWPMLCRLEESFKNLIAKLARMKIIE